MTHFLVTEENPDGQRLEDVLAMVRGDMIKRAVLIIDDDRQEARRVLANNVQIMSMLTQCIELAEENTTILTKAFGPSQSGKPRIGSA